MINVKVNNGDIEIIELEGKAYKIMTEVCGIVRAICTACWEDEENGDELTETMIFLIAKTLTEVKPIKTK